MSTGQLPECDGAGLAKAIMEQYPVVAEEYHKLFKDYSKEELFGQVQFVPVDENFYVANLFTQFNYGNPKTSGKVYTDENKLIEAVYKVLDVAARLQPANAYGKFSVYVPYEIGCGYGGGNWDSIYHRLTHLQGERMNLKDVDFDRLVIYDTLHQHEIYKSEGEYENELC